MPTPVAPVLILLQLSFKLVFTGLVTGIVIVPLLLVFAPNVELFAILKVKINSFNVVTGALAVMPDGRPVIVPKTGVTLVVPI